MGRFLDEGMNNALDTKQMLVNAFQLFEAAEDFVSRHLPIASHFREDSFERVDEMALPPLAIREAIINAIIHRDYSKGYGDISLKIFNTHLEIHNIGILYGSRKLEHLTKPHSSLRRNKIISNAFFSRKLIDQWGGGISRIQEDCSIRHIPLPTFTEYSAGIAITFKFKRPIGPAIVESKGIIQISSRQEEILEILQSSKLISISELAKKYNKVSESTLKRDLDLLRKERFVSIEGIGRNARWKIEDSS